jgi:4-hydroxy-tetrahydrodipicolinate reductase
VAIEFTQPEAALLNIKSILGTGTPVISGTTGWLSMKAEADEIAEQNHTGFLYASNFSLGVNLFFVMNEKLAALMAPQKDYSPRVHEIHHTGKKDAPSGTAITTAEAIIAAYPELKNWSQENKPNSLQITDERIDPYCGTHTVTYESSIDKITLEHHAHSREGFAQGAVLAAEWIIGRQGVFGMRDVLGL